MNYYLVYQKPGEALQGVLIPKGYEDTIDRVISRQKGLEHAKLGKLEHEEIKGIFTEAEYQGLKVITNPADGTKTMRELAVEQARNSDWYRKARRQK